jgi:CBS domain-containing protein
MSTVGTILSTKGTQVHTIPATVTVLEATQVMNQHKIGALVVTEGEELKGIFTERDVLRRVVGNLTPPSEIPVADVMTHDVMWCTPDTEIDEAGRIMRDCRVRHLPVCDGKGHLVGLLSIGDINAYNVRDQEATIQLMNEYIHGRV